MRFEKKQIAAALAAAGSSIQFDCQNWREKSVQVIGTGTVDIEGTIDGATWKRILSGTLTSPSLVIMPETVAAVRATYVSGSVDVWLSGFNSRTE